jgi:hypothetical protein
MNLEQIIWHDAFSVDEWTDKIEDKPCVCETIGFVVKENDNVIAVSHTRQIDIETYCCTIIIPKSCIVSRTSLKAVADGSIKA